MVHTEVEEEDTNKKYRCPLEAAKDKDGDSPLKPPEWMWHCLHLDFNTVKSILDSSLQRYKRINLVCFKPPSMY